MSTQVGVMATGAFLAALLVLIPWPGHWRARNIPTLSIMLWLFLVNTARGVNVIAWGNNVDIKLVVWCDIVTRLDVGATVALPAACFCLCMHLERVASVRLTKNTFQNKKRRMLVDSFICFGVPAIYLALFYIVQGHRFDIVEGFGCRAADYVSLPQFFLVWFPPIIFALGTFLFAGLSFVHFLKRRIIFAKHLNNTSSLTPNRFFRLMAMSVVQMIWIVLVISLTLWTNYRFGLRPWTNWDDVHSNWSRIGRFPIRFIPPATLRITYFLWWTTPISAFLFTIFFAFGQETRRNYTEFYDWLRRVILKQHSTDSSFTAVTSQPRSDLIPLKPPMLESKSKEASVALSHPQPSTYIAELSPCDSRYSLQTSTATSCEHNISPPAALVGRDTPPSSTKRYAPDSITV